MDERFVMYLVGMVIGAIIGFVVGLRIGGKSSPTTPSVDEGGEG